MISQSAWSVNGDLIPQARWEQPAAVNVILESSEATKASAQNVHQENFKTLKESRHAKNVQSTRTSPSQASPPKQTAKNVRPTRAPDQQKATSESQHACAGERTFTKAPLQHAWIVPLVPTALKKMACNSRRFMPCQDIGGQLLITINLPRVARKRQKEIAAVRTAASM